MDVGLAEPVEADVQPNVGSTNQELLLRYRLRRPATAQLLAADEQTAGRGRQRRPWVARPRTALLFSLAVPLPELLPSLPAIAPACGAALADQLIERGIEARLKWPNDLLLDGRKLGGILCELAVDADGQSTLVIGVQINVLLTARTTVRASASRRLRWRTCCPPECSPASARPGSPRWRRRCSR